MFEEKYFPSKYKTLHMGSTYRQVLSFLKKDKQNKKKKKKLTSTDVFILFSKHSLYILLKEKKKMK